MSPQCVSVCGREGGNGGDSVRGRCAPHDDLQACTADGAGAPRCTRMEATRQRQRRARVVSGVGAGWSMEVQVDLEVSKRQYLNPLIFQTINSSGISENKECKLT